MSYRRACLVLLAVILCMPLAVRAAEMGHYMPTMMNNLDYFVPQEQGVYYVQYNLYYRSTDYRDDDGNKIRDLSFATDDRESKRISYHGDLIDIDLDVKGRLRAKLDAKLDYKVETYGIAPTCIWATPWDFLGANYAMYVSVPVLYSSVEVDVDAKARARLDLSVDVGVGGDGPSIGRSTTVTRSGELSICESDSQWDLGDIVFQPVWLGWNWKHYDLSIGYGVYAPTGDYDVGALDNTGMGFWTHQFQAAGAWYPWEHRGTAVVLAATHEIHHEKEDEDITPGDHFTLSYGVSQFLPLNEEGTFLAELGLSGFSQLQVDDDSGSDVTYDASERGIVHGAGIEVGLVHAKKKTTLFLRWMREFEARNHFQGDFLGLMFAKGV